MNFTIYVLYFYDIYYNFLIARRSIYLETQHPDGLEKIRELEAQGHPAKLEIDEPPPAAPTLTDLWVHFYFILLNFNSTKENNNYYFNRALLR